VNTLDCLILVLVAPLAIAVGYLYLLAVAAVRERKYRPEVVKQFDLLVLVPAHNEELVLGKTLQSLKQVTPIGKFDVVVIADNCNDRTVEIARSFGVKTIERSDSSARGKGHALQWGMSQLDLRTYDAVAIVDADTLVESNMVNAMASSLASGYGAVQLSYVFMATQMTHLSHLQHVASMSENMLFYRGRSALNLPILLRGSGMAIATDVLEAHPWNSFSITEDVDYAVDLLTHGTLIDFNYNSTVFSAATSTYRQSVTQKTRWASGTIQLVANKMIGLVWFGLRKGKPRLIELGISLLLLSRPVLILAVFGVFLTNIIIAPPHQMEFSIICLTLIGSLILYLMLGICFVHNKVAALKSFCMIPLYGVWFLVVQVKAIVGTGKLGWQRTERKT
jgi:cellulose synthase/poly-beta-1,6-N-acetylglucosamine synthase-like glycosyltransferase